MPALIRSPCDGLGLSLVELQQEDTKQAGVLRCADAYPLFSNCALNRLSRIRVWMHRQLPSHRIGYPDDSK